jgi:hypothetical protein
MCVCECLCVYVCVCMCMCARVSVMLIPKLIKKSFRTHGIKCQMHVHHTLHINSCSPAPTGTERPQNHNMVSVHTQKIICLVNTHAAYVLVLMAWGNWRTWRRQILNMPSVPDDKMLRCPLCSACCGANCTETQRQDTLARDPEPLRVLRAYILQVLNGKANIHG